MGKARFMAKQASPRGTLFFLLLCQVNRRAGLLENCAWVSMVTAGKEKEAEGEFSGGGKEGAYLKPEPEKEGSVFLRQFINRGSQTRPV